MVRVLTSGSRCRLGLLEIGNGSGNYAVNAPGANETVEFATVPCVGGRVELGGTAEQLDGAAQCPVNRVSGVPHELVVTCGPDEGDEPHHPDNEDGDGEGRTGVVTKTRPKTKKPSLYKVLLLNDDYTPMEFVVHVLESFFGKSREDATEIMLHVHHKGVGICGVYTYEVAETKVTLVTDFARKHQHPLQCTMEKE